MVVVSLIMVMTIVAVHKIASTFVGVAMFFDINLMVIQYLRQHKGVMGNHPEIRSLDNA